MTATPGPGELTSATLLRAIRQSPMNDDAWNRFVSRYESLIQRWCRSWGLQESDSNDVTQEVLLRLAKSMQSFEYDPDQSFRAWLKTVTHNTLSDWAKQVNKPGKGHGDTSVMQLMLSVEAREDFTKRFEDSYDTELLELAMLRVQMSVSPRTWDAFRLTAIEGLKGAEAAAQLKMQVAHVYVARSEVKQALKKEISRLETSAGH